MRRLKQQKNNSEKNLSGTLGIGKSNEFSQYIKENLFYTMEGDRIIKGSLRKSGKISENYQKVLSKYNE